MKLDVRALAITAGVLWAVLFFLTAVTHEVWSGYGTIFLEVMDSLYPGYEVGAGFGSVVVGTVYALFDAGVSALIFGWLYNTLVGRRVAGPETDSLLTP